MTAAGSGLPDAAARTRAATIFDRNLVVTAGAGTGKTALLVERALNLIAGAGAGISNVAAITFTEKAAAELRQRLAAGLDALRRLAVSAPDPSSVDAGTEAGRAYAWLRSAGSVKAETIAQRCRAALADLDAAQITTIHAFCSEILHRHPSEGRVDPGFVVDEGETFESLFDEEWERFLLDELAEGSSRAALWGRVLRVPEALAAVRELARSLARFGIPEEVFAPGAGYAPAPVSVLLGGEISKARGAAFEILSRATGMNPNMQDFLAAGVEMLDAFLEGGSEGLETIPSPVPLEAFTAKGVPSPGKNLAGAEPAEVSAAAKRAQDLVKRLVRVDEKAVGPLVEAALPLAVRARERLLASGSASFDALLALARDLLASHAAARRETASRYATILVDEFQDTDPLQYEILFLLAAREGSEGAGPWESDLAPGRLFIVGDPKQSIYRFRGADMQAYRRAVDRVLACGGEHLTLSASFRSPSGITDPLNDLFSGWIGPREPEDSAFEPAYEPIRAARGAGSGGNPRVEIWTVAARGRSAERRREEGEAIASWMAANLGRSEATGAPLRCKDVAILLRALTHADLYTQALRRSGVPFVVEGGRGFYERREVSDLIAFLRAAANRADAASLLAVLRSPLGAAPDAELARYVAAGGRLDRPEKNDASLAPYPNIQRTHALLNDFRKEMRGKPVDEIIRAALTRTPLLTLHAACFEGPQRAANMRKLISRGEVLARRGLSLEETLRFIEAEYRDERAEGESPLADETVDAVRILSVHKAKGLEYPVVFTPDVGREPGAREEGTADAAWVRTDSAGYVAVRLPDGRTNLAWAYRAEMDRRHDAAEEKRVLYVAATRAKERLILVNSSLDRRAPWREALAAWGYEVAGGIPAEGPLAGGRVVHRVVQSGGISAEPADGRSLSAWVEAAESFKKAARAARKNARPPFAWPSAEDEDRDPAAAEPDGEETPTHAAGKRRAAPSVARLSGLAVHAVLERCPFGAWEAIPEILARQVDLVCRSEDSEAGGLRSHVLAEAREILEAFRASPLPSRLEAVEVLGREVRFVSSREEAAGSTWLGCCDLIYRDGNGNIVVADYKTDRIEGDVEGMARRYAPQMAVYLDAVRRAMPGEEVRGEILFLRAGAAVPI